MILNIIFAAGWEEMRERRREGGVTDLLRIIKSDGLASHKNAQCLYFTYYFGEFTDELNTPSMSMNPRIENINLK